MIGDVYTINGIEFEVVWAGGEGLVPERRTKVIGFWTPPHRMYNKTGKHGKKFTYCDECEARVLLANKSEVSAQHDPVCSLHPSSVANSLPTFDKDVDVRDDIDVLNTLTETV